MNSAAIDSDIHRQPSVDTLTSEPIIMVPVKTGLINTLVYMSHPFVM